MVKLEKIEKYPGPQPNVFTSFCYVESGSDRGNVLYIGTNTGRISYYIISVRVLINRLEELTPSSFVGNHTSAVVSIIHSRSKLITNNKYGLLFTASKDRTIKVWSCGDSSTGSALVQTLHGHSDPISVICDGEDGSIVSCSIDGSIRVWTPQLGRSMMLHPFFECSFVANVSKTAWMTALAVNSTYRWTCYVADSVGNIDVYGKAVEGDHSSSIGTTGSTSDGGLQLHSESSITHTRRWERVHRLGINKLKFVADEGLLITLSSDGTCKVLDSTVGTVFFTISNIHRCIYTGLLYNYNDKKIYLVDEMGYFEVFCTTLEKTLDIVQLLKPAATQVEEILKAHREPVFTDIAEYPGDTTGTTFIILSPSLMTTTSVSASLPVATTAVSPSEVSVWRLLVEGNRVDYFGHDGVVVGLSVPPYNYHHNNNNNNSHNNSSTADAHAILELPPTARGSSSYDQMIHHRSQQRSRQDGDGGSIDGATEIDNRSSSPFHALSSAADDKGRKLQLKAKTQSQSQPQSQSSLMGSVQYENSLMDKTKLKPSSSSASSSSSSSSSSSLSAAVVSREEARFFSVGATDKTIRCWDEYDRSESYQIFMKGLAEVTAVRIIWSMSAVATGLEDGTLLIWHSDAGSKITSKVLKNTISSLIDCMNSGFRVLIGADFSGRIAVWNMTIFKTNPGKLQSDTVFQGFHDPDDPGITALAFHDRTKHLFSGGHDTTVRYWRIGQDASYTTLRRHAEAVCLLECSDNYLLSGDEGGEMVLWYLTVNGNNKLIPTVIVAWSPPYAALGHQTRCIATLHQSEQTAFIAQARGGRSQVWQVTVTVNEREEVVSSSSAVSATSLWSSSLLLQLPKVDIGVRASFSAASSSSSSKPKPSAKAPNTAPAAPAAAAQLPPVQNKRLVPTSSTTPNSTTGSTTTSSVLSGPVTDVPIQPQAEAGGGAGGGMLLLSLPEIQGGRASTAAAAAAAAIHTSTPSALGPGDHCLSAELNNNNNHNNHNNAGDGGGKQEEGDLSEIITATSAGDHNGGTIRDDGSKHPPLSSSTSSPRSRIDDQTSHHQSILELGNSFSTTTTRGGSSSSSAEHKSSIVAGADGGLTTSPHQSITTGEPNPTSGSLPLETQGLPHITNPKKGTRKEAGELLQPHPQTTQASPPPPPAAAVPVYIPPQDYTIEEHSNSNKDIRVQSVAVVTHEDYESSCYHIVCRQPEDPPSFLYMGTVEGPVLRFKLSISASFSASGSRRAQMVKSKLRAITAAVRATSSASSTRQKDDSSLLLSETVVQQSNAPPRASS